MFQNLIEWYYHKKAIFGLRQKYRLDIAVDRVLKDWITDSIIHRKQEFRRKELIESQKSIAEKEMFYKWINIKK